MAEGKLYFAYGSNINLDQMAQLPRRPGGGTSHIGEL